MSVQERRYLCVKAKKDEKRLQKALGNSTDCSTDVQQQLLHSWGEQLHTPPTPPPPPLALEEFRATMFRKAAEKRLKAQIDTAKTKLQQKKKRVEYLEREADAASFAINQVEGDTDPLTNEFPKHWKKNMHAYQVARNELLAAQKELDELE